MVSRKEKQRATEFIAEQLDNSGLYAIINRDYQHVLVKEKNVLIREPRTADVLIANFYKSVEEFGQARRRNLRCDFYVCPILYKDDETAFVRMVEHNSSLRREESLKNYTLQQINQMISLRKIEKAVLDSLEGFGGNKLTYYQPSTIERDGRLDETLREFELKAVRLDYSHIGREHQAYDFVENRVSIDYKIPEGTQIIQPAAKLMFSNRNLSARLVPAEIEITDTTKLKQNSLRI
jgi:hypothetical protein